eukprot:1137235-Pelagomonas_calceolata.AAC.7
MAPRRTVVEGVKCCKKKKRPCKQPHAARKGWRCGIGPLRIQRSERRLYQDPSKPGKTVIIWHCTLRRCVPGSKREEKTTHAKSGCMHEGKITPAQVAALFPCPPQPTMCVCAGGRKVHG